MPLLKEIYGSGVRILLWRFDETADEMWTSLSTHGLSKEYSGRFTELHTEKRRREWLAVRCLVREALGDEVCVSYTERGRPFLKTRDTGRPSMSHGGSVACDGVLPEISVTHSGDWAAVAFAPGGKRIGIDLEGDGERAWRIRRRFLQDSELASFGNPEAALLAWCAKEAVYKLVDREGQRFLGEMVCRRQNERGQLRVELPALSLNAVVTSFDVEEGKFALACWEDEV